MYCELINTARHRGTITYSDVAKLMGISEPGHHMAVATGHLLGEISDDEHGYGRPMLSAIAVSSGHGMPGSGFFELAQKTRQIGYWRE